MLKIKSVREVSDRGKYRKYETSVGRNRAIGHLKRQGYNVFFKYNTGDHFRSFGLYFIKDELSEVIISDGILAFIEVERVRK